jgi:ubiquinone/menaquinone biosynthesis C-methylase UbiE
MSSHTARNARAYDQRAHEWAAAIADDPGHKYLEKPAMEAELADDLSGASVLCIGVGAGHELPDLLRRRPARVVAIDVSSGLLRIAASRYPAVRFVQMDMSALALTDRSFDLVYSSLALHYANDWDHLLAGVHRVLRPAGTLLFSTHHPAYWAQKPRTGNLHANSRGVVLTEHVATLPAANVEIVYYNHADERSISDSLRHAGFDVRACFAPDVVNLSAAHYGELEASARERYDEIKGENQPRPLFLVVRAVRDGRCF